MAFEVPALAWARLLIAERDPNGVAEADAILARQLECYEGCHQVLRVMKILVIQALLFRTRGEMSRALEALERAVRLATPRGMVRVFVDEGPALGPLLLEIARDPQHRDFVTRVVNSFGTPRPSPVPLAHEQLPTVEQLTEREIVVLELMAQRLSNKEIARQLTLSWLTVSKHASHIFSKLQVSGRRAAVERARRLGLLPLDSVA